MFQVAVFLYMGIFAIPPITFLFTLITSVRHETMEPFYWWIGIFTLSNLLYFLLITSSEQITGWRVIGFIIFSYSFLFLQVYILFCIWKNKTYKVYK